MKVEINQIEIKFELECVSLSGKKTPLLLMKKIIWIENNIWKVKTINWGTKKTTLKIVGRRKEDVFEYIRKVEIHRLGTMKGLINQRFIPWECLKTIPFPSQSLRVSVV